MLNASDSTADNAECVDVLVVGAGFAGMYTLIRARGHALSTVCIEAAPTVGGVWFWNQYPGARCDIESLDYSYSFDADLQDEWTWTERYATQPEILRYAEHVADRYDLRDTICFSRRVVSAVYSGDTATWTVEADDATVWHARHVVLATGSLSSPNRPDIVGLDTFAGQIASTAQWPDEGVDVRARRVGVIGTGSSAVQSIPILAAEAEHLTVFQRSPNYSVPVRNRELNADQMAQARLDYPARRAASRSSMAGTPHSAHPASFWALNEEERRAAFEERWNEGGVLYGKVFDGQTVDQRINDAARDFAVSKIRSIVRDPETAANLIPDYAIGTKRICTDSGYYDAFNRDNVRLVNVRTDPIVEVTPRGITTVTSEHGLDVLVLATGFDALTGAVTAIGLEGPRGDRIGDLWSKGPVTNLGIAIPGLPNLHVLMGPGAPGIFSNAFIAIEQQVDWVIDLIHHCITNSIASIETTAEAAREWTDHVQDVAAGTLFPKTDSWYMGANIEGKNRVFMPYAGGHRPYAELCARVRDSGYAGFTLTTQRASS